MLQPKSKGRMVVCGSAHMFSDEYIDKEENAKIFVSFVVHDFGLLLSSIAEVLSNLLVMAPCYTEIIPTLMYTFMNQLISIADILVKDA